MQAAATDSLQAEASSFYDGIPEDRHELMATHWMLH